MAKDKINNLREKLSKIEAISRVLKLTGLNVDIRSKEIGYVGYVPEYDDTLFLYAAGADELTSLHIGHEVYHHFQNLNGQLLEFGSKEEDRYIKHTKKVRQPENIRIAWTHYKWPHERQAEVFGWVFAERYAHYKHRHGKLTESGLQAELSEIKYDAKLKNCLPEDTQEVAALQAEMNKEHDEYTEKYAAIMDNELEAVFAERRDINGFSFKLIG